MSNKLVLAPTGHPAVPPDEVLIEIEVDYSRCQPSIGPVKKALDNLNSSHLNVSISQIIAYAGTHYRGAASDHWGIGIPRAEIQRAWENILSWKPTRQLRTHDKAAKLVLADLNNSRDKALVSEVLAVGVGLIAARHVYDIPYRFWSPTPGLSRTDFKAPNLGGEVHLEVRGRFDRKHLDSAKNGIYDKFGLTPTISGQLGAIYCPRTTPNVRTADLILIDPDGTSDQYDSHSRLRALLRHYAPFYTKQGYNAFGGRLIDLSESETSIFENYLSAGDDGLRSLSGIRNSWRTSFLLDNYKFIGTSWEASAVPAPTLFNESEAPYESGVLYWAIWEPIHNALVSGDLESIATAELSNYVLPADRENGKFGTYIGLEDGTAIAWARKLEELMALP